MGEQKKPAIRYKGFTDDWEQRELGALSKRVIVGLATSVTPYYRETGIPIFRNLNIKENYLDDTDILYLEKNYAESQITKQIHVGDVLTVHTGYIGTSCVVPEKYDKCLTFTTLITTTDKNVLIGEFLAQYLNSDIGMSAVQSVTTQGGRQNLNTNDFIKVPIHFPSIQEQKKICTVLRNLDHLITLHQRKYEKLVNIKKSMLEKMFPKDGAKVPEIRLNGFTDDWEQHKLGELGSVAMCKRIFKEQTSEKGDVPFYKIGTFGGEPDAFISRELFDEFKSKYPYPKMGDILLSASGSIGRTVEYMGKEEYFQDSNIVWLSHDNRIENSFLKHFYQVVKWSGLEGSTIQRLYNENILKTQINLPSHDEQKEIGCFFTKLDNLITLHQRKLEKLQNIKKSMLEKMFV